MSVPFSDASRLERDAQHLAAIVDSSDDAIVSKDLNGIVRSWNRAAELLFGYSSAEIVGQSIRLIIPADRQGEEDTVLAAVRSGKGVDHFETIRRRKDGSLVSVSLTVSPIRDATGEIVGASKIARDLTRIERARRDEMHLAAIVDSSDDAIISKDLSSTITSWNLGAERLFGYTPDEIIGRSIRLLIPSERQNEEDNVLTRVRAGQRVEHYETVRLRKDGAPVPVSLTVSPIRNAAGTVTGASQIARDIGERERAEQESQRLLELAREASRLKDEFLATLSHELRTPLNGIVGYVRLMQMDILTGDKQDQAIDAVGRCVSSLMQIVEDVLDISRIISGKIRLHVKATDFEEAVRGAIETVRPAIEAKHIRLIVTVESDLPHVCADQDRLRQVLWNVLSNAVKFTPKEGDISIGLSTFESNVQVSVTDSGIGIGPDFLPFVFDRFRQADAGPTRAASGLGLGLAISRHLIEAQGGRIWAESEGIGRGATFRIDLPTFVAAAQPADVEIIPEPLVGRETRPALLPVLAGYCFLAVDDEPDALVLLREALEATGARVVTAESATRALELLETLTPDVILSDLAMPGMSGFELIDRVRRSDRPEIQHIPAVALTAYTRSEDKIKAIEHGFQLHLSKPLEPLDLLNAVEALVTGKPQPPVTAVH